MVFVCLVSKAKAWNRNSNKRQIVQRWRATVRVVLELFLLFFNQGATPWVIIWQLTWHLPPPFHSESFPTFPQVPHYQNYDTCARFALRLLLSIDCCLCRDVQHAVHFSRFFPLSAFLYYQNISFWGESKDFLWATFIELCLILAYERIRLSIYQLHYFLN